MEKTPNTLTCVYCGMAYPEGTPPHGARILTEHIKVCEKHPMRQAMWDAADQDGKLEVNHWIQNVLTK